MSTSTDRPAARLGVRPVTGKDELLARLRANAGRLRELRVRRLELFGSFARREATAASDIDLLVDFEPGEKTYDRFLALSSLLEELLGRPVELLTHESLSPHIGPRILAEAEDVAFRA